MTELPLVAPRYKITADGGYKISWRFRSSSVDLTGQHFKFVMWDNEEGPVGDPLFEIDDTDGANGQVTVAGGSPSYITVTLKPAATADLVGLKKWTALVRTDSGFERPYGKGQLILQ